MSSGISSLLPLQISFARLILCALSYQGLFWLRGYSKEYISEVRKEFSPSKTSGAIYDNTLLNFYFHHNSTNHEGLHHLYQEFSQSPSFPLEKILVNTGNRLTAKRKGYKMNNRILSQTSFSRLCSYRDSFWFSVAKVVGGKRPKKRILK